MPVGDELRFFRPEAVQGIELLVARESLQRWHFYHERYAVCPARAATGSLWYRGVTQDFDDRSLTLYEPGEVHRSVPAKPATFTVLFIDPDLLNQAAQEMGLRSPVHFAGTQEDDGPMYRVFEDLATSLLDPGTVLEQQSRVQVVLTALLAQYAEDRGRLRRSDGHGLRRPCYRGLDRVRDCIGDHFDRHIALRELAAIAGLSRFHLVRAFAERFGAPPHTYQNLMRVGRSRALLRAGATIAEVTAAVGFADQSHFARRFRAVVGVTPGTYARMVSPSRKAFARA